MYDDIINWIKFYHALNSFCGWETVTLDSSKKVVSNLEKVLNTEHVKPILSKVTLTSREGFATVPVYDFEHTILSILKDESLMKENNLLKDYKFWTGEYTGNPNIVSGVHTGSEWAGAVNKFCKGDDRYLPFPIACFYDKTKTDLHGSLSVTPFMFVPLFFKGSVITKTDFWNLLGYIPNLSYGRATGDGTSSRDKLQDEHFCIYETLKSLMKVHRKGGIATTVRLLHGDGESGQFIQKKVVVRPWIHFISGDHEGHNQLCAHFNTFNKGVSMPFRDCHCKFDDMDAHTYKCQPVTAEELKAIKGNEVRMKSSQDIVSPLMPLKMHLFHR